MKFTCKEISINNEGLGCQVCFSENADLGSKSENMSLKEIMEATGKYLLIQRFYPEDDFEDDSESANSYYETHDNNLCGDFENFELELSRQLLVLKFPTENIEISIQPSENEFTELKTLLIILTNKKGKITINENQMPTA